MSNTTWFMDIDIYAINSARKLSRFENPNSAEGISPTAGAWDYGPIVFAHESEITLDEFVRKLREVIMDRVDDDGYPWFGVYATPYLMQPASETTTAYMMPNPEIDGGSIPNMRKLNEPAWTFPFSDTVTWPSGFTNEFRKQLIVRYDITANRTDMHNRINTSDSSLTYYGFKINWRSSYISADIYTPDDAGPFAHVTVGTEADAPIVELDGMYDLSTLFGPDGIPGTDDDPDTLTVCYPDPLCDDDCDPLTDPDACLPCVGPGCLPPGTYGPGACTGFGCPGGGVVICFVAGTKISVFDEEDTLGYVNIEDVCVGDFVGSYNFETSAIESQRVTEIMSPMHDDIVEFEFTNGAMTQHTFDHPYYVVNKGWASYAPEETKSRYTSPELEDTQLIEVGDRVVTDTNKESTLIGMTEVLTGEIQTYNIIVENNHNYFADGILVHNKKSSGGTVAILEDAPLPPNVRIFPYRGVSNKVGFFLSSNTGRYRARPIPVQVKDLQPMCQYFISQNFMAPDPQRWSLPGPLDNFLATAPFREELAALDYANTDQPLSYEIFRLTERPSSYRDFDTKHAPHTIVTGEIAPDKDSTAAVYIDNIQPNKKYYYCVRARSKGTVAIPSNPSIVYEVELVDNEGQVYIILETLKFMIGPDRTLNKPGRRFIYIEPSLMNLKLEDSYFKSQYPEITWPNILSSTIPLDNLLGSPTPAAATATRKFPWKIRVTSKKTGRKFDLNLIFKNTGVENPEG